MVFDLEKAEVALVLHGQTWCNLHPQYCRSTDPEESHDILVQENHGNEHDEKGDRIALVGGAGADIHVIRDDGTDFRTLPWGRDGNESCQGHQCWRGRSTWAITSTGTNIPPECQLIESRPVAGCGHVGLDTPRAVRNDLSRQFPDPNFYHFATDIAGRRLITDSGPMDRSAWLFLAELGRPGEDPLCNFTGLLKPRSSWRKDTHVHPFLSPDGTKGFFNSDESGLVQAYMVRGLENV